MRASAQRAGFSLASAQILEKKGPRKGDEWRAARLELAISDEPVAFESLSEEARRAWEEFGYFRRRYMGRVASPWQEQTAERLLGWLASPEREYVVENVGPGFGKSTLLVDIACWLTVRNRGIRGLFISASASLAERNVMRVRRELERVVPVRAKPDDLERGWAFDAESTLAADYGRFKPTSGEVWKRAEFVVVQSDGGQITEKEPTWSSFGYDSEWIGNRFDVMLGDDLDSTRRTKNPETVVNNREIFDNELEPRLEPGGLLAVCQQRLSPRDFSAHCLAKSVVAEDEEDAPRQYHHIIYKAHYDDICVGDHGPDAKPYPDGCMLDPKRMSWRETRQKMANPQTWSTVYQQEDSDPGTTLVKQVWISGGVDPDDGVLAPGCMDNERGWCEPPIGIVGPAISIATVDPSPTKMWALQWWLHYPDANTTFLMDLERMAMPANELLDWNATTQEFYGWMEEWQKRSVEMGVPITNWIVEINAAQRFLLAYNHVRRWQQKWGVGIIPHSTTMKKLDPNLGPWILRDHFKHGRIRLPGKQGQDRYKVFKLTDELTRWPEGGTDDQVMAAWFLFAHLPRLTTPEPTAKRLVRPSWMRRSLAS